MIDLSFITIQQGAGVYTYTRLQIKSLKDFAINKESIVSAESESRRSFKM